MPLLADVLKTAVFRFAPPRIKDRIRRAYVQRAVTLGASFPEREGEVVQWLVEPGDVAVDIGASVGFYTRLLAQCVGSSGRVFAFEPIPQNFSILESVVGKEGLANVELVRGAIDGGAGTRWMVVPEEGGFEGFYTAHFASQGAERGDYHRVPTMRLDDWFAASGQMRLDFIKCDVEGAEPGVIAGGADTIRRYRPGLLMEVARATSDEIFGFFSGLGYQAFAYGEKLQRVDGYLDGQFSNYFFLHQESRIGRRPRVLAAMAGD